MNQIILCVRLKICEVEFHGRGGVPQNTFFIAEYMKATLNIVLFS